MTATTAVTKAAEARRRKERRRRVAFWVGVAVMVLVIATAVVISLGVNNSWWVQKNPVASSDQQAPDGTSTFSQTGIDFLNRAGVAKVSLAGTRPSAAQLGLKDSGSRHIDFLVPITVTITGTKTVELDGVDGIDLTTANGRLSSVEISPSLPYSQLTGQVVALAPQVGWSSSAVTGFQNDLVASRQSHDGKSFSSTIGPAASTGMRVSATLSGDQSSDPTLVIRFVASPS